MVNGKVFSLTKGIRNLSYLHKIIYKVSIIPCKAAFLTFTTYFNNLVFSQRFFRPHNSYVARRLVQFINIHNKKNKKIEPFCFVIILKDNDSDNCHWGFLSYLVLNVIITNGLTSSQSTTEISPQTRKNMIICDILYLPRSKKLK